MRNSQAVNTGILHQYTERAVTKSLLYTISHQFTWTSWWCRGIRDMDKVLALGIFVGSDKKDDNVVGNSGSTIHLKVKCLGLQVCKLSAVFGLTQVLHQAGTSCHLVQAVGALPKNRAVHSWSLSCLTSRQPENLTDPSTLNNHHSFNCLGNMMEKFYFR